MLSEPGIAPTPGLVDEGLPRLGEVDVNSPRIVFGRHARDETGGDKGVDSFGRMIVQIA